MSDVDACYDRAIGAGLSAKFPPRDAEWGERYFHLTDPDGHEVGFARPLGRSSACFLSGSPAMMIGVHPSARSPWSPGLA